jgi:hypothetical protein
MFSKIVKAFGILALILLLMFGAVEVWLNKNQEKLFRKVQSVVNDNLNGNLEIEDFRFRPFSGGLGLNFSMVNVKLTDSLYAVHKTPFLQAELMHVALDFNGFYKGDIKIKNLVLQNGNLKLFIQKDGYSNLSIFKKQKNKKKDGKSGDRDGLIKKLGNLRFINFAVSFADSTTGKAYGALFHDASNTVTVTDTTANAHFAGAVFFNGLIFRPEKGGFLINQETNLDLAVNYDSDRKTLKIAPSTLQSATNDTIGIEGKFNFADSIPYFELNFSAHKIPVVNALPLLNKRVREQIDSLGIKTNVDTKVRIAGKTNQKPPRVDVHFKTDTFQYNLPVGVLKNMRTEGTYTNQGDTTKAPDVENARLTAPEIQGSFETIPFKFSLILNNFTDPRATIDGVVRTDAANLGPVLDPARYRFKKGKVSIDFHFNGNLKKFYAPTTDHFDGNLFGKVSISNVSMDYVPRQIHLSQIKGEFAFNEKALVFPSLSFSDGQNMLFMQGKVMDLIPYLFGSPKPLRALVNVNIPTWRLNWLETLLAPRQFVSNKRKKKLKLVDLLDNVIDKIEIVTKLQSKEMRYKHFTGNNVRGEFTVKNNSVRIENFSLTAFGATTVKISGEMDNSGLGQLPYLKMRGYVNNADVHKVFYAFDNFGQKTITYENLKGKLSANFNFETRLNNNVKIVPGSMKGLLHFDLNKGYLINFEPLLKIKKLMFKKRNFERVEFSPIRSDFRLKGQEIEISPMEIESNVITLFIDGIYSFARKTDISIQIPLSNLKKRDSTYVLNPNDPENRQGSRIYLRAIDENGEVNIKLAFRKRKEKEKETASGKFK